MLQVEDKQRVGTTTELRTKNRSPATTPPVKVSPNEDSQFPSSSAPVPRHSLNSWFYPEPKMSQLGQPNPAGELWVARRRKKRLQVELNPKPPQATPQGWSLPPW